MYCNKFHCLIKVSCCAKRIEIKRQFSRNFQIFYRFTRRLDRTIFAQVSGKLVWWGSVFVQNTIYFKFKRFKLEIIYLFNNLIQLLLYSTRYLKCFRIFFTVNILFFFIFFSNGNHIQNSIRKPKRLTTDCNLNYFACEVVRGK